MSEPRDPHLREWRASSHVSRMTVDLHETPDLVVMYLGMRAHSLRGVPTMLRFGRRMSAASRAMPDGLLHWERMLYSPRHVGMRQYWRDLDTLERWARSPLHLGWWREYLQDAKGTGFWHETYLLRGGMEAIYDGMPRGVGLAAFAEAVPAEAGLFSARHRVERARQQQGPP